MTYSNILQMYVLTVIPALLICWKEKQIHMYLSDLSSDGVDMLINDIKEHLVEIETILRE